VNPGESSFIEIWSGIGSVYKRCVDCGSIAMTQCVSGSRIAIEDINECLSVYATSAGTFVVREDIWNAHLKRFLLRKRKMTLFSKAEEPPRFMA
jgi:hypothetical protein